ncbi:HPP family protein [Leucobacter japonicus]|uniref:HPP family protein n=1 Tax=Leucobacter japonicus TaxID=1461259 RepID=UPI0009496768|nr:HPP family protein [Leucobacter japonicus]
MFSSFFIRPQARLSTARLLCAAGTGAAVIAVLSLLGSATNLPLLAAAFGSSCVLVFTLPDSPLSKPVNVIGGHVLSAAVGLIARFTLPTAWWSLALAVGVALAVMAALRVTHPPAGGTPIAIMLAQEGWWYLLTPILIGSIIVSLGGTIFRYVSASLARRRDRELARLEREVRAAAPAAQNAAR